MRRAAWLAAFLACAPAPDNLPTAWCRAEARRRVVSFEGVSCSVPLRADGGRVPPYRCECWLVSSAGATSVCATCTPLRCEAVPCR